MEPLHINGIVVIERSHPTHPVDWTVVAEVTPVLALSDALLGALAADLTEGTVGV